MEVFFIKLLKNSPCPLQLKTASFYVHHRHGDLKILKKSGFGFINGFVYKVAIETD